MTPLSVPFVDLGRQFRAQEADLAEIFVRVGRSGGYVMGEALAQFEQEAAAFCGVRHAIGVANGTDALVLILRGLGIGPGDEVITAVNSFIASAGAIAAVGATPVFADVGDDLNIDPADVEARVTPRTKAIMPVHLTGRPADMDALERIAAAHGLAIVEDAAQAIGARYRDRPAGSLGTAAAFSLHPLKNLNVMGDGGFLTTDDDALAARIRRDRNHGLVNRDEAEHWGLNSRLDALQAAVASYRLARLDAYNERFRAIAARYREGLAGLGDALATPEDRPHEYAVYHNFVVLADRREALMAFLAERGVETKIHYPILLHRQAAAASLGHRAGDFPTAERLAAQMLSLPIYPELEEHEIEHVVRAMREFYDK